MTRSRPSVAIAMALIIDAAVDPLIGSFSDHLKSRLGRRHPLMYLSAVPIAVGLYLVFSPPAGLSETLLLAWLFGAVVITHVSMSLFVVPVDGALRRVLRRLRRAHHHRHLALRRRLAGLARLHRLHLALHLRQHRRSTIRASSIRTPTPCSRPVAGLAIAAADPRHHPSSPGARSPTCCSRWRETPRFSFLRVWRDVSSTFVNRDFLMLFIGALLSTPASPATTDTLGHLREAPTSGAWRPSSCSGSASASSAPSSPSAPWASSARAVRQEDGAAGHLRRC